MSQWNARQLQVVWFSPAKIERKARDVFALLSKDEPTATQTGQLPTPLGNIPFEQAQGVVDGFVINIQKQSNRIDFIVQPEPNLISSEQSDKFGDYREACEFLKAYSKYIDSQLETTNRLGVVANFVMDQNSSESATNGIVSSLGLENTVFRKSRDINLQANFPVQKSWGRMNRTCKWAVEMFRNVQIIAQSGMPVPSMGTPHYVSALMLDINTAASVPLLSEEHRAEILEEAVNTIEHVWTYGDLEDILEK